MSKIEKALAALMITMGTVSSAWAQKTVSKACTEQERSNQTLSERLDQTNGAGRGEDAGHPTARQPGW
jgi:hypothetical protein